MKRDQIPSDQKEEYMGTKWKKKKKEKKRRNWEGLYFSIVLYFIYTTKVDAKYNDLKVFKSKEPNNFYSRTWSKM